MYLRAEIGANIFSREFGSAAVAVAADAETRGPKTGADGKHMEFIDTTWI